MARAAYSVRAFAKALITCEKSFAFIVEEMAETAVDMEEKASDSKSPAKPLMESREVRMQHCIQLLIELNNSLQQPDAARGILMHAKAAAYVEENHVPAKWNELLGDWDGALKARISHL